MSEHFLNGAERFKPEIDALVDGNIFLIEHLNRHPREYMDLQLAPFKYEREDESLIKASEVNMIAEGAVVALHDRLRGEQDAQEVRSGEDIKYWTFHLEGEESPFYVVEVREKQLNNLRGRKIPLTAYVTKKIPTDYDRLLKEKEAGEKEARGRLAAARVLGPTVRRVAN